jgi:hypothetical protein
MCRLAAPALLIVMYGFVSPRLTMAATHASRSSSPSLSAFVLSTNDVRSAYGTGLKLSLSKVMPNRLAIMTFGALGVASTAAVAGRVTGYETEFVGRGRGIFNVVSIVNVYKASSDAQRALTIAAHAKPQTGLTSSISSMSGVGSGAVIEKLDSPATSSVTIGFQRGRYTAAVAVGALGSKVAVSTVVTLAKLMDGRIKAHG